MATAHTVIRAPATEIFDVLLDPECYPRWVVGAHHIRDVDAAWPRPGSAFHHQVGVWPFRINDSTTLVRAGRPLLLELRARAWPLGEADVRIELEQRGGLTRVTIHEDPASGPGRAVRRTAEILTTVRNRRSLARLKDLVERGRSRRRAAA